MGMFDVLTDELFCPYCGFKQDDFQTKDTACMLDKWSIQELVKFHDDKVVEVHSVCVKCKKYISININLFDFKYMISEG